MEQAREGRLTDIIRDRYVVTNLPQSWSVEHVIDESYLRCDEVNVIEQLGSGLAMWRAPVKEFAGSEAWLEIARLGWNLRTWLAQLRLPAEVVRWEWKRFRQAFVFLAALTTDGGKGFASDAALPTSLRLPCGSGIHRARQVWHRFAGSHRLVHTLFAALLGLSP
ncbi:hypothetical protein WMF30_27905 [Sorangium sp. So ce134]